MLVAAGLTTNALGEVAWYTVVIGSESTDVSLADVGWVVSYFFLGAALWISLVQSREGERFDLESVIDALTIVAVSVLTLWNFSVAQIAGDPSLTPLVKLVWSTYPIMDAILIGLVIRIATDRRARATIDPWFGVGVAAWLVADIGFLTLPLSDFNENWENAGWMIGAILMARFHRGGRRRADDRPRHRGAVARQAGHRHGTARGRRDAPGDRPAAGAPAPPVGADRRRRPAARVWPWSGRHGCCRRSSARSASSAPRATPRCRRRGRSRSSWRR